MGCGAGNSVFPLLELNAQLQVFACDFSPKAVQLVQAHPAYASGGWQRLLLPNPEPYEGKWCSWCRRIQPMHQAGRSDYSCETLNPSRGRVSWA